MVDETIYIVIRIVYFIYIGMVLVLDNTKVHNEVIETD